MQNEPTLRGTGQDKTAKYNTLQDETSQAKTKRNAAEFYEALQDFARQFRITRNRTNPLTFARNTAGRYRTIQYETLDTYHFFDQLEAFLLSPRAQCAIGSNTPFI